MGIVHRVVDPALRRQLAMKVILARKSEESPREREKAMHRTLARFLEEAQVTSQLDHPGVVPVHELGIDSSGRVYFTMRLVRGRDLRRILELVNAGAEGWTRARALHVLLKVCEAVAYAHDKRVIHRDLKPSNIRVGRFGEVYVMDWGLARVLDRRDAHDLRVQPDTGSVVDTDVRRFGDATPGSLLLSMDGNVLGTPQYMSPEQACNNVDTMGPRSDVYSLGAILYELLALARPDAPEELAAICAKAMAHKPERRYATALELAADIEAYLHHRPVTALAPSLLQLARLWYQRNERLGRLRAAEALLAASDRCFTAEPDAAPLLAEWLREVAALLPIETESRQRLVRAQEAGDLLEVRHLEAPIEALRRLREETRPAIARWFTRLSTLRERSVVEPVAAAALAARNKRAGGRARSSWRAAAMVRRRWRRSATPGREPPTAAIAAAATAAPRAIRSARASRGRRRSSAPATPASSVSRRTTAATA